MLEVFGSARNLMFAMSQDNRECSPLVEVILITSEARYQRNGEGVIVRDRNVGHKRFMFSPHILRGLSENFAKWADEIEALATLRSDAEQAIRDAVDEEADQEDTDVS